MDAYQKSSSWLPSRISVAEGELRSEKTTPSWSAQAGRPGKRALWISVSAAPLGRAGSSVRAIRCATEAARKPQTSENIIATSTTVRLAGRPRRARRPHRSTLTVSRGVGQARPAWISVSKTSSRRGPGG
jgi:hypothetical protein